MPHVVRAFEFSRILNNFKKKKWPRENMSDGSSNPVAVVSDFQEDSKRDLPDGPELGPQRHCRGTSSALGGQLRPCTPYGVA